MSEAHPEKHSSPSKTRKQLVVVVLLAFLVLIILIVMLPQLVTTGFDASKNNPALSDAAVAQRLKPVGEVEVIDPSAPQAAAPVAAPAAKQVAATSVPAAPAATPAALAKADANRGKTVYAANCVVCHASGIAGAPKAGDKAAWAPRLKTGMDALYAASLKGKGAMPPKGGNLSLADADVRAAVDYLAGTAK